MDDSSYDPDFEAPGIEELQPLFPAYHIEGFIAQGGMGAVYVARQISLDRPVAIKILPRQFGDDPQFRASFEAEAKAMAKLNHPNLIGVYDFGDVEGMLFIIMEFVEGKSLYHSAYGKAIEEKEAARIVTSISRALAHAHQAGILHRDIKPANILLAPGAIPKIGDFGLARPVGQDHRPDEIVYGTPGYSAPEVVNHPEAVDQRADIFAVGVLLYELLTGQLPPEPWQPPSSLAGCSPAFDSVVRRATHPSPQMRYANAEQIADDLNKIVPKLGGTNLHRGTSAIANRPATGPGARPIGTTAARPMLSSSKSKSGPILIAFLVIAIVAVGALILANSGKKEKPAPKPALENPTPEPVRVVDKKPKPETPRKETPKPVDPKPEEPKPEEPKPQKESITQALARLRPKLLAGDFSEMPRGTAKRGDSHFVLVEKARDWSGASRYAEEHGAHLAVLEKPEDLAWATEQFKSPAPLWLGLSDSGTETKWHWLNGSPPAAAVWAPSQPSDSPSEDDGEDFAALLPGTDHLDDLPSSKSLPFLLQWTKGGSEGSVASQLKRTGAALKAKKAPVFPAGARNVGGSRFLLVAHKGSWEEASALATAAGGHLAVPSNPDEALWITDTLRTSLGDGEACWMGGRLDSTGRQWEFVTGETFDFVEWAPDQPDDNGKEQSALQVWRTSDGRIFGYDNGSKVGPAPLFLLEWSVPSRRNMPGKDDGKGPGDAREWLLVHRQNTQKAHKVESERFERRWDKNVEDFIDDIESEADTARRSQIKALEDLVDNFTKAIEENGEIPAALENEFAKRAIGDIHEKALKKQNKIKEDYQPEFDAARGLYLLAIQDQIAQLIKQGDREGSGLLTREHKATSEDESRFRAILRGEFPPVPEEGEGEEDDE